MSGWAVPASTQIIRRWTGVLLLLLCTCAKSNGPSAGSETHFLRNCADSCPAPYTCSCGVCTLACSDDLMCAVENAGAVCSQAATREACRSAPSVCEVTCGGDAECASLGGDFVCSANRCREREGRNDVSGADSLPDMSIGTGNDAGSLLQDSETARGDSGSLTSDAEPSRDGATTDAGANPDEICDGSTAMRLGITADGGMVDTTTYAFTNPYGHTFLFVDGMCRYYVNTNVMAGTKTGTLNAEQARELANAIGWSKLAAWSSLPLDTSCPDAGEVTIRRPGVETSCSCGCDPTSPADRSAAFDQIDVWLQRLASEGAAPTGSVSAIARRMETPTGNELAWPLLRSMSAIPGLITEPQVAVIGMAQFDLASEAAQLRDLRNRALLRNMFATFIPVEDAGTS